MDTIKKINTPYNNAIAILNRTNELLNENNIMDSTGSAIAQLEQNITNPAWLFALACGQLHTSWQEKIAKAYSALDAQNCEDDQVLVLASIAGIKRGNGTPTHVTVLITNLSADAVTIPIGFTFTETYANQTWVINKNLTISGNAQQYVTLYSTTDGEYNIPIGTPFFFEGSMQISVESYTEGLGGSTIETISSLRNRISSGEEATNFIVQAKTAIELLSGIESCSIWFNTSIDEDLVIGTGTSTSVEVIIENNSPSEDITVLAGTIFTDPVENKDWELFNDIDLSRGGQKTVVLYSVDKENINIPSGTVFTYTVDLPITCTSSSNSKFGAVTIPPREAYISIKGYDYAGKIAETYYNNLDVPATVGEQQEEFVLGQQPLTVNFDYATEVPIKIYVSIRSADMAVGAEGAIKTAISAHSGTLACGENVTSQMVSEWVQNLGYGTIINCGVGTQTGMSSVISPTEYCVFNSENIVITPM